LLQADAGNVFATDSILAHLMAAPRTVLPWDIVATYLPGGVVFLDVRDPVKFEMATVNENAHVQPPESSPAGGDINGAAALSIEASVINQSIAQAVSSGVAVRRGAREGGAGGVLWEGGAAGTPRGLGGSTRFCGADAAQQTQQAQPHFGAHTRARTPGSQHPTASP
jgi:hypothetical protein